MTTLIVLSLLIIILSGLFSGLEAALFAVSPTKVALLKSQKKRGSKALSKIKKKISRPITVIVIGNNIVNIVGSIFVGAVATEIFHSNFLGIISAVLTFLIIIFGEIIPKTFGENNAEKLSLFFAPTLLLATKIFSPFIWFIEIFTKRFIKPKTIISEEEIQIMSHLGSLEGSIEKTERELIKNTFALNDTPAAKIMTSKEDIYAFDIKQKLEDIEDRIYDLPNSRLPVYSGDLDHIKGTVHKQDLLVALAKDDHNKFIGEFMTTPLYVKPSTKADDLLPLFQKKRTHMAIVRDSQGRTVGVVTLEDVLEELVGEIVDETDEEE